MEKMAEMFMQLRIGFWFKAFQLRVAFHTADSAGELAVLHNRLQSLNPAGNHN